MRNLIATIYLVFIILTNACTPDMEMRSEITKFRILGIQAEPAQIIADIPINLKALFAVPKSSDAKKKLILNAEAAWVTVDPSSLSLANNPKYIIKISKITNNGETVFNSPDFIFKKQLIDNLFTLGGDSKLSIPVYILGCNNGKIDAEILKTKLADINVPTDLAAIEKACKGKNATANTTFKTLDIFVPDNNNPDIKINTNPVIDKLLSNKIICTGKDGCRDPVNLKLSLTPDSFEYFLDFSHNLRNEMEDMYVDWYSDGGEFSASRIRSEDSVTALEAKKNGYLDSENNYILDIKPDSHWFNITWLPPVAGGNFHMWVTVRDIRGGISWKQFTLTASAPDYKK